MPTTHDAALLPTAWGGSEQWGLPEQQWRGGFWPLAHKVEAFHEPALHLLETGVSDRKRKAQGGLCTLALCSPMSATSRGGSCRFRWISRVGELWKHTFSETVPASQSDPRMQMTAIGLGRLIEWHSPSPKDAILSNSHTIASPRSIRTS